MEEIWHLCSDKEKLLRVSCMLHVYMYIIVKKKKHILSFIHKSGLKDIENNNILNPIISLYIFYCLCRRIITIIMIHMRLLLTRDDFVYFVHQIFILYVKQHSINKLLFSYINNNILYIIFYFRSWYFLSLGAPTSKKQFVICLMDHLQSMYIILLLILISPRTFTCHRYCSKVVCRVPVVFGKQI